MMSVSLFSQNIARKLLLIQFLAVMASGLLFSLKDPFWGHFRRVRRYGSLIAKYVVYDFCHRRHQALTPAKGRVAGPSPSAKQSRCW